MHSLHFLCCLNFSVHLNNSGFIGTTFAWFTDTDTAAAGKIESGKLDIEIVDADGNSLDSLQFVDANNGTNILWEPGATFKTQGFKLKNNGSLWLKYKLAVNNTEVSANKLNEVITFSLVKADGTVVELNSMEEQTIEPGKTTDGLLYIQGHMSEAAGNAYQELTLDSISVTVYATQYTKEVDMTDDQYDKDAKYDDEVVTVSKADQFISAFNDLKSGQIITLTSDIDMTGKSWTPVSVKGFTLEGNNHKITGLSDALVSATGSEKFSISDVTFDNLTVKSSSMTATPSDGLTNCSAGLIKNADTCSYILMDNVKITNSTIEGAYYAGGFVGYTSGYGNDNNGPVNASHNFTDCSIKNSKVTAHGSSAGGLIGHCGSNAATTTRINNFTTTGTDVAGKDAAHTGTLIGTANLGIVYFDGSIDGTTPDTTTIQNYIGRFVPDTTGKLVINGSETTAKFSH